jgi:MFS family permease
MASRLNPDSRRIIAAQGLRAAGYGCTSVLLGALLAARGYSALLVGVLLGCIVAGTAVGSLVCGKVADRIGRRRRYVVIFLGMALAGATIALGAPAWVIVVLALLGMLSTDSRQRMGSFGTEHHGRSRNASDAVVRVPALGVGNCRGHRVPSPCVTGTCAWAASG